MKKNLSQYKNLVILLADQLRHDAPGYAGGRAFTPCMDALAGRGVAYSRAYTSLPVCAPARQALLCGRHPDSFGAFWNHGFFHTPPFEPEVTFTGLLAASGRRGGYVGKWDVSPDRGPEDFGFDFYAPRSEYAEFAKVKYPDLKYDGGWMGCENPIPLENTDTHFLARRAAGFIRETYENFFLWVDFGVPHLPCRPSPPFSRMYDPAVIPKWLGYDDQFINKPYCHRQQTVNWRLEALPWEEMAGQVARYYGMVSQLDDAFSVIVSELEDRSLLEDTLIIVTSDHGDMCGNHRMLDKHYVMYDDIVRVPLMLSGSSLTPGRSDALVSNCLDLPVTICSLMGLPPLPAPHGRTLPLDGEAGREYVTSSSSGQQFGFFCTRMITDGRYKYVWNLTDTDELYDTLCDSGECDNLIRQPEHSDRVSRLRRLLHDDLKAHGDPFANEWLAPQLLEDRKN